MNTLKRLWLWISWRLIDMDDAETLEEYIYRLNTRKIY